MTDLCGRALEVDGKVAFCNRLRAKNTGEPVPLLMTLKDSSKVGGVLGEARKLRVCTEFSGIFVKKDCTPLERAEMKRVIEERETARGKKQRRREERKTGSSDTIVNLTRKCVEKEVEGRQGAIAMLGKRDRVDTKH